MYEVITCEYLMVLSDRETEHPSCGCPAVLPVDMVWKRRWIRKRKTGEKKYASHYHVLGEWTGHVCLRGGWGGPDCVRFFFLISKKVKLFWIFSYYVAIRL